MILGKSESLLTPPRRSQHLYPRFHGNAATLDGKESEAVACHWLEGCGDCIQRKAHAHTRHCYQWWRALAICKPRCSTEFEVVGDQVSSAGKKRLPGGPVHKQGFWCEDGEWAVGLLLAGTAWHVLHWLESMQAFDLGSLSTSLNLSLYYTFMLVSRNYDSIPI